VFQLRNALRTEAAHYSYFPPNQKERKRQNLKLAREIGYGFNAFPNEAINNIIGSLYGKLIVANSFDQTGVAISNKEFIIEIKSQLI
jgi:hypothetical protein